MATRTKTKRKKDPPPLKQLVQETQQPDRVAEPQPAYTVPLPQQTEFFKIPARFGHVPVTEEPIGYDKERKFEHHYPRIELPFQVVDVVKTGAEKL